MATETKTPSIERYALLVGIDDYQRSGHLQTPRRRTSDGKSIIFRDLEGAVNDVLAVRDYLTSTMKLKHDNIEMLLAPVLGRKDQAARLKMQQYREPTYKNIVDALKSLAVKTKPGDLVYIHYSGHGARATTVFGDLKKELDAEDHALVPCDVTSGGKYLRDLEIGALLSNIAATKAILTVVLDSCHSGGALRGDDEEERGVRGIPSIYNSDLIEDLPDTMDVVQRWGNVASWMDAPSGFVVLAACLEHQKAREMRLGGVKHGRLTYWLLDTIRNSPLNLSSQAINDRVYAKIQDTEGDQTPYMIGDTETIRFFFDPTFRSRVCSLPVTTTNVRSNRPVTKRTVGLGGGLLHGVQKGSIYAVLSMEVDLRKKIQESDILARVEVKTVETDKCTANFIKPKEISHWERIKEQCPAVLQRLPINGQSTVLFDDPDNNRLCQLKKEWEKCTKDNASAVRLRPTDNANAYFKIRVDKDGNFQITDQPGNFASHVSDELDLLPWDEPNKSDKSAKSDSMAKLIDRLDHLARFRIIRGLENPGIREDNIFSKVSITVEPAVEGKTSHGYYRPATKKVQLNNGVYEVPENEWFHFAIKNSSEKNVGCVILDCMPEFGISIVYPYEASSAFISVPPGEERKAEFWLGIPEKLEDVAGQGIPIVDVFKVFLSVPERNLYRLTLPKLRIMEETSRGDDDEDEGAAPESTLDSLLEELAPLTRDGHGPQVEKNTGDWQTFDFRLRAIPNPMD